MKPQDDLSPIGLYQHDDLIRKKTFQKSGLIGSRVGFYPETERVNFEGNLPILNRLMRVEGVK